MQTKICGKVGIQLEHCSPGLLLDRSVIQGTLYNYRSSALLIGYRYIVEAKTLGKASVGSKHNKILWS